MVIPYNGRGSYPLYKKNLFPKSSPEAQTTNFLSKSLCIYDMAFLHTQFWAGEHYVEKACRLPTSCLLSTRLEKTSSNNWAWRAAYSHTVSDCFIIPTVSDCFIIGPNRHRLLSDG